MRFLLAEHREILVALIQYQVDFLIIGGYSVIIHGYERTTGDMDIWLRPDNSNKLNFIGCLEKIGFEQEGLAEIAALDFTKHHVFTLNIKPQKIDFLTIINQVGFEEAFQNRLLVEKDGLSLPFINVRELVLSKMNTGRGQDKVDIEELQRLISATKK